MFDVLQTLANGCVTNSVNSCIVLTILGIVLVIGATNVLVAVFQRHAIEIKEEEEKKS